MADNTTLPVPSTSGDVIATDDIDGVKYQRVKMTIGADGVDDGDVSSTNPLPVEIQGSIPVTIASAIEITNDAGNAIPVSAASLPLPTGAATEASLSTVSGAVSSGAMQVKAKRPDQVKWSFAKVVAANGIDTEYGTLLQTGSGMAVSQSSGNLVITTGTTAYSETVIRSVTPFSGSGVVRYGLRLSQRIAQNNFAVEFVDVIGDGLAMTINSATSVTVTKTAHGFTSENIGNGIWIGLISVASCLTQRAVIASVTTDTITLTVSGFPASGSGTCSLFGWNYHQVIYSGTGATALGTGYVTQRKGWANAAVNATISTTASGHIGILETSRGLDAAFLDQVQASGTSTQATQRATANQNIPDVDVQLYLQIRAFNGSSAPATTTTLTMGFVDAQMYDPHMVNVAGIQSFSGKNAVQVSGSVSATITGTATNTPVTPTTTFTNSAASTNATSIKASAGTIWSIVASNVNAAARYLKFYNKASAPTVGTDVPVIVITLPAGQTVQIDGGSNGIRFGTGIALAITTGMADSDTGAVVANEIKVATSYT